MRKPSVLLPLALLTLTALPAVAQEMPLVLFCQGQCLGVDEAGKRVPVTKGTRLAPGLRLETGPDSYAQVKLGADTACGIGERSRVRFDQRVRDKDVVILDQGRIRLIGGEAIGRPGLRPVELHTTDGKFDLKSADIEVKSLPKTAEAPAAPTLVKLNVGEARLGDIAFSKEAVQGISGGKVLERTIPIGDIALTTPRREAAPVKSGESTLPAVREPFTPVAILPSPEPKLTVEPIKLSTAIMSTELLNSSLLKTGTTLNTVEKSSLLTSDPAMTIKAYVPPVDSAMILKSIPIETGTGTTTSLTSLSKDLQLTQKTGTTGTTSTSSTTTQLLTQKTTLQTTSTTLTSPTTILSPKLTTTTFTLR